VAMRWSSSCSASASAAQNALPSAVGTHSTIKRGSMPMNEQEAITRAEAWYRERYYAVAHGHIALDAAGQELRDTQELCVDLVPEQGTTVVNVLVGLTGDEPVALLDEDVLCPRCKQLHAGRRGAGSQEAEQRGSR
jgi:hypothetical protein